MSSSPSEIEKRVDEENAAGGIMTPQSPQNSEEASPRKVHGFIWVLVLAATISSIFLYSLDNTVVADVTPAIINTFGDNGKLSWLSVGFTLGGGVMVMPFGRLYGLFDARQLYLISVIIFNAGSALCGGAPNMDALIIGRVLAGSGGTGMYLGVMTILSVSTSDRERPGYLSFVGLFWGIGTILGPVVGGAFTQSSATWRWAFYINLCIAGLFAPVYLLWIPSSKPFPGTQTSTLIRRFDIVGTVLIAGLVACLIMGINFGGTLYAWSSGQIIALFVVAGVLAIIFAIQQTWTILTSVENRIFPIQFMGNVNAILLYVCASAMNTSTFIPIYYIPLYFQFTRGDGALDAAVRLLPLILTLSATILANGHLMSRWSYFQPWYIFGSALALVGGVLMSRVTRESSKGEIYGYEILLGFGCGSLVQAGYAVIQAVVPPAEMAYAISFMMLAQIGGIAIGLSIGGAVFVNEALKGLVSALPGVPRAQLQSAVSGTSSSFFLSLPESQRDAALDAIVSAVSKTYIPVYVGAAVALVSSLLFTQRKLFKGALAISA